MMRGEAFGALTLSREADRPYTAAEIELAEVVAKQLSLAVQASRLATESEARAVAIAQATEQEKAARQTAEKLKRTNDILMESVEVVAASGDVKHLLEHFLRQALSVAGADRGSFALFEGGRSKGQACVVRDGKVVPELEWIQEEIFADDPKAVGPDLEGFFQRLIQEGISRDHVEFARQWWPAAARYHERENIVEVWTVPCIARGQVIATLGLEFTNKRAGDSVDTTLIALAQQASLALELARLAAAERENAIANEREQAALLRAAELARANRELELRNRLLAAVAEVSARLARMGDFATMLPDALQLIGKAGDFSRVLILEERRREPGHPGSDHYVTAEWCAHGIASHHDCGTSVITSEDAGPFLDALRSGQAFWCRLEDVHYPLRNAFEAMGIKATGCAPLLVDGGYWGNVAFDDCVRSDPWDTAHVDALTAIAQAISNALQTRRDSERMASERERSARARAQELVEINSQLRDNLLTLSQGGDSQKTLQHILSSALKQLQAVGTCVFTLDEAEHTLQITASADRDSPPEEALPDRLGRCAHPFPVQSLPLWKRFVATRAAVLLDAREDEDAPWLRPGARQWHLENSRPVVLGAPLAVANRLLGYLSITFPAEMTKAMVSTEQLRMAESLASLAAMTIETDRLARRAQDAAIAEERNRLAHELHDTLAGAFTGIFMQLQAASDLPDSKGEQRRACILRAEELARTGLRQVREFVHTLTINGEQRWKTVELMRKSLSDATAGTGMEGAFFVDGMERLLKVSVSHALQRILQEALGNAQRYARATKIEVSLKFEDEAVGMTIRDNGAGFDPQSVNDSGFGIPGMRTRVARLAGTFSLDSGEGRGTTITVKLPEPYQTGLQP
jgi:signal transduction histidine kinase